MSLVASDAHVLEFAFHSGSVNSWAIAAVVLSSALTVLQVCSVLAAPFALWGAIHRSCQLPKQANLATAGGRL